jgi:hypothetical protein
MNPRPYVWKMSLLTAGVVVPALLLMTRPADLALAILCSSGAVIWLFFGVQYLFRKERPSDARRRKDRAMRECFLAGILLPAAAAWACVAGADSALPYDRPIDGTTAVVIACCLAVIPLSVIVSSAVDWYLIRPFREGVYGAPVCQHVDTERAREAYASYWVLHRGICEFVVYSAIAGIIAFGTATVAVSSRDPRVLAALNIIGVGAIVWPGTKLLWLLRYALAFVMKPRPGLGDWVTGRNCDRETIEGFLVDLSIAPGVQLIERPADETAADEDSGEPDKRYVALEDRGSLRRTTPSRPICRGGVCEFWIPDCEVGIRAREAAERRAAAAREAGEREPRSVSA